MAFGYRVVSMFPVHRRACTGYAEGRTIYSVAVIPNGHRHLENVHLSIGTANGLPSTGFTENVTTVRETRERILHQQYAQASMKGRLIAAPGLYGAGHQ